MNNLLVLPKMMCKTAIHSSLLRHVCRGAVSDRAFTLLEVMIAVSIIAIALVTLLGSQSRSLSYAAEAQFNTVAPMLASMKLAELDREIIPATNDDGDFGDDFEGFRWKMEVNEAIFDQSEVLSDMAQPLRKVALTVWWNETPFSYTLTCYGRWQN